MSGGVRVPGLGQIAAAMMIGAEQRIDVTATNVSNISTPGYRARRIFAETLDARSGLPVLHEVFARPSENVSFKETGSPFDFATDAGSVLALSSPQGVIFTRSAQLHRDGDGRLIDQQGRALQGSDGGDLVVTSGKAVVSADGTVLVDGQPQGQLGLFDAASAQAGRAELIATGSVKQGMVVGSDVELGDEMLELNKASRFAETGARLFQINDDLLGKTASLLGSISK